jgi:hypothetical protein
MPNSIRHYDSGPDAEKVRPIKQLFQHLVGAASVFAICICGCSRSAAKPSETHAPSPVQSLFYGVGEPSRCSARCVSAAVTIGREGLGLDPKDEKTRGGLTTEAIFGSLEKEGTHAGSTITRVPVAAVIEKITEGPAVPVILVHTTGHLYLLFGAIRVNDKLLCQIVHGDEAVSLVTKQSLLEGGFREAWRIYKKRGVGTPIHIGSAIIEIDSLWHNFGEVFPDKPLECTFRLKNVGDKTVILGKPTVSCRCIVPNLDKKTTLAPGKVLNLKVATQATGATSLRNSIGLTFYEKGSETSRQEQLSLIGSERESMEVTPTKLDFGLMTPGKPCSRSVTLREKPTDRFVVREVDPGTLPMAYRLNTTRDKDGLATYRIHLELNVGEERTEKCRGELVLTTDSYVRPKVRIPVEYQIAPPVETIPSVISLGTVVVGDIREQSVRFVSRNGEPLNVEVENHPDECSVTLKHRKDSPELIVAIKLKEPGIWQGVIRVKVRVGSQEFASEIKCVGYGWVAGQKH